MQCVHLIGTPQHFFLMYVADVILFQMFEKERMKVTSIWLENCKSNEVKKII